jgi:hypothetical protein
VIEATSTGGRRSGFFTAEKLAPGNLGLLQQYRHSMSFRRNAPIRERSEAHRTCRELVERVDPRRITHRGP